MEKDHYNHHSHNGNHEKVNNNHDKSLPDTGNNDQTNGTLFASLFATVGALFLTGRRRKKDNEEK
ncbi:LPXTG cell wall anchor domain-containing protein [Staphylococcus devriesei]